MSKSSAGNLEVNVISFGFKHGLPPQADIVMDVRFLQNPHWVEGLKDKTGLDPTVGEYVARDASFAPFMKHFRALLETVLTAYAGEESKTLAVAVGCTGGRHRSVYVAESLAAWLEGRGVTVRKDFRDLDRS